MPGSVAHGALPPLSFRPPTELEQDCRTKQPTAEAETPALQTSSMQRRAFVHSCKGGPSRPVVVGQIFKRAAGAQAPLAQPEAVNDAGPVASRMLSHIAPPALPKLTREDERELYERVGVQLALLAQGLRKPLSWKERLLPRCLRRQPVPEKNEVLSRVRSIGDAVIRLADAKPDPAGYQVAFSRLVQAWVTGGHDRSRPREREHWRWRTNDPKGSFMAASKALSKACGDVRHPFPQPSQNLQEARRVLMTLMRT